MFGSSIRLLVLLSVAACAPAPATTPPHLAAVDLERERATLLALNERQRRMHFEGDAKGFGALLADEVVYVERGAVERATRAQNVARFEQYFAAVEFLEWDDITPPIVTISRDGTLATVAVHKRVTVVRARASRSGEGAAEPEPETSIFAWTSTLEKRDGKWLITQIASTRDPDPAATLVAGSVRSLGSREARAAIHSVSSTAEGTSPQGPYSMTVDSVRGGSLRFYQSFEEGTFEAWVRDGKGWTRDAKTGALKELDDKAVSMLRGHEFQLVAITLGERFADWKLAGTKTFANVECDVLTARDELGSPVRVFLRRNDQRLVGMIIADPRNEGGTVRMTIDDWTEYAGVALPSRVTAVDHQGTFVLSYDVVSVNVVDEATWPEFARAG